MHPTSTRTEEGTRRTRRKDREDPCVGPACVCACACACNYVRVCRSAAFLTHTSHEERGKAAATSRACEATRARKSARQHSQGATCRPAQRTLIGIHGARRRPANVPCCRKRETQRKEAPATNATGEERQRKKRRRGSCRRSHCACPSGTGFWA